MRVCLIDGAGGGGGGGGAQHLATEDGERGSRLGPNCAGQSSTPHFMETECSSPHSQ